MVQNKAFSDTLPVSVAVFVIFTLFYVYIAAVSIIPINSKSMKTVGFIKEVLR